MASLFKRKTQREVGTDLTSVEDYVIPANTISTVIGLSVSNITNAQIIVNATLDTGTANTFLIKNAPVPLGATLIIVGGDQKVVMEEGDQIRIQSDTANSADVVMSVLEIF